MEKYKESDGVWRTIGGRKVFIRNGQSLSDAMKESGKFKNQKDMKQQDKTEDNIVRSEAKPFKEALDTAKKSQPEEYAWRVDNTSHGVSDYEKCKCFTSKGGSTVAITKDGDIISVCKNTNDAFASGRDLIELAVSNGGKKLDSYDGNYGFYVKCGFEPVSWCEFNETYAPSDWKKGRDKNEPIIFFKYTGKKQTMTRDEFYSKVSKSVDYDEAMEKRDKEMR